jgi:hypothetical protein
VYSELNFSVIFQFLKKRLVNVTSSESEFSVSVSTTFGLSGASSLSLPSSSSSVEKTLRVVFFFGDLKNYLIFLIKRGVLETIEVKNKKFFCSIRYSSLKYPLSSTEKFLFITWVFLSACSRDSTSLLRARTWALAWGSTCGGRDRSRRKAASSPGQSSAGKFDIWRSSRIWREKIKYMEKKFKLWSWINTWLFVKT